MTTRYKYNLLNGSFLTGWREVVPRLRKKKARADYPCNKCDKRFLCGLCPPFFELETGAEDVPSQYLCAMGHHRFQAIKNDGLTGG
jgi:sulfatase maturation enzyme AslB (radical SAM superfamily)